MAAASIVGCVALDAVSASNPGIGRLYTPGLTNAVWVYSDSVGLVTAFDIGGTKVPEPATLALFGIALAGFAAVRRRKSAR